MSPNDTHRAKLARLTDAIIEDIVGMSDADILAQVDKARIAQARTILIETKDSVSKRALVHARAQLDAYRSLTSSRERSSARSTLEQIHQADPAFNQGVTMAARNGKVPSERDKEGLDEDWADLQELNQQGDAE